MIWSPWTTTGIQCYNAHAMSMTQDSWTKILSEVRSNTDYPLWLLLQSRGYRTTEFRDFTFKHVCSNGDTGSKDQAWYVKRIKDAIHNHKVIRSVFAEIRADDIYFKRIDTILKNRINRSIKDGNNIKDSTWTIPVLKHFDQLNYYVKTYLED